MPPARARLLWRGGVPAALAAAAGAALTLAASYGAVAAGLQLSVLAIVAATLFVLTVIAFLAVPHWAVAGTVLLYPLVPSLKVFVNADIGVVKDAVDFAAAAAALLLILFEHRRPDRWVALLVLMLLGIYLIDPGGAHGAAWAQGVRLVAEPLLLLIVGSVLPDPRRTLRYGFTALIAVSCIVGGYGILQQLLGPARLVSLGYSYSSQVRMIGAFLRSFGTLDDPFEFAALMLLGLGVVFFWVRRGPNVAWITTLLLIALAASFVRTGLLVLLGYLGLWLARRGRGAAAALFIAAALVAASVTLVGSSGTQTTVFTFYQTGGGVQTVQTAVPGNQSELLNGRLSAWSIALGRDPADWLFGRGVGTVGTAAARATYTFASSGNQTSSQAVDSAYFATIADVGLIGLAVAAALWGRLMQLAARYARRGVDAAWAALALIVCVLLDGLTRAVFTEFPTMFLAMLLIGLALSSCAEQAASAPVPAEPSRWPESLSSV